jgi:hypothetical protein
MGGIAVLPAAFVPVSKNRIANSSVGNVGKPAIGGAIIAKEGTG